MFDPTALALFFTASLALLLASGPAVLYIVARSLAGGRLAGLVSVFGVTLASSVHILFAALGLCALFMQSALAFSAVKYLGAAYLIYLAICSLLRKPSPKAAFDSPARLSRVCGQGFMVNLLNPKTAYFSGLPAAVRGPGQSPGYRADSPARWTVRRAGNPQ